MKLTIKYFFKRTAMGWKCYSDFVQSSCHKGLFGYGKTKRLSMLNLSERWNKKASATYMRLKKQYKGSATHSVFQMTLIPSPINK